MGIQQLKLEGSRARKLYVLVITLVIALIGVTLWWTAWKEVTESSSVRSDVQLLSAVNKVRVVSQEIMADSEKVVSTSNVPPAVLESMRQDLDSLRSAQYGALHAEAAPGGVADNPEAEQLSRQLWQTYIRFNSAARKFSHTVGDHAEINERLIRCHHDLLEAINKMTGRMEVGVDAKVAAIYESQNAVRAVLFCEVLLLFFIIMLPVNHRLKRLVNQASQEHEKLEAAHLELLDVQAALQKKTGELEHALAHAKDQSSLFEYASNRFQQLFGGLPVGCLTYDRDGMVQEWNPAMTDLFQIEPFLAVYQHILTVFNRPDRATYITNMIRDVLEEGQKVEFEWEFTLPEDEYRAVYVVSYPLKNPKGQILGGIAAAFDITSRKEAELALTESEERFNLAVQGSFSGIWDWHVKTDQLYWSPRTMELFGADLKKFSGRGGEFWRRVHPLDKDRYQQALTRHLDDKETFEVEIRIVRDDGGIRWVHVRGQAIWDAEDRAARMAGSIEDITERKKIELALAESEERFDLAVRGSSVGIYDIDVLNDKTYFSPVARKMFALDSEEGLSRQAIFRAIHPDDRQAVEDAYNKSLREIAPFIVEYRVVNRKMVRWHHARGLCIADSHGNAIRLAGSIEDITERKNAEVALHESQRRLAGQIDEINDKNSMLEVQRQELEEANTRLADLATTDGLTGLKNHKAFQTAVEDSLKAMRRSSQPLSVIILDVDNFKRYNDSFGHPAGDEVLRTVAAMILESIREIDVAARYGGEEFVVVLPNADSDTASMVAERIRSSIENHPWALSPVTASFGVATARAGSLSKQELIDASDQALYRSKRTGKNRISIAFDSGNAAA
jgi:diguanylate cyclase (GGDEF)-like protein/PAS domain S-box-containing protein